MYPLAVVARGVATSGALRTGLSRIGSAFASSRAMSWGGKAITALTLWDLVSADNATSDDKISKLDDHLLGTTSSLPGITRVLSIPGTGTGIVVDNVFVDRVYDRVADLLRSESTAKQVKEISRKVLNLPDREPTTGEVRAVVSRYPLRVFGGLMGSDIPTGEVLSGILGDSDLELDKNLTRIPMPEGDVPLGYIDVAAPTNGTDIKKINVSLMMSEDGYQKMTEITVEESRILHEEVRMVERSTGMTVESMVAMFELMSHDKFGQYMKLREKGLIA